MFILWVILHFNASNRLNDHLSCRSLVDTVYALKDQVATLLKEHQNLKKAFESEQIVTRQLRALFKQHFLANRDDIVWDPEPWLCDGQCTAWPALLFCSAGDFFLDFWKLLC